MARGRQPRGMDLRRVGGLLATVAGLLLAVPGPVSAASWGWPLAPRPEVAARFAAPAGPYAAGHRGVDLVAPAGAPVLAPATGTVAFAGRVAGRGVVSVDHPGGLRTTYEPVAARVSRGEPVALGSVLGLLEPGPSHCPPATCLHWGLRRGAVYLDPLALLGVVRVRLLPVWALDGHQWPAGRSGPTVRRVAPAQPGADPAVRADAGTAPSPGVGSATGTVVLGTGAAALIGGPLLVRAARAGPRRAGGSRRARCRPGPRPARSRAPPSW